MENFHAQVAAVELDILGKESNPLLAIEASTTYTRLLAE